MAALRSARVLMFSRPFVVVGLPPFAVARCVATVCHRLRWHVNNFFQNFFPNPTKPQANTHKKLLSHAARCAIVSVRAWIPGRTRAPKRSRLTPRPNARTPTRTRTPVHASAHARTYARTCAHASARPRAQGSGEGQITTLQTATQRRSLIFLRARNWSLLRNCYGTGERRNTLHRDSGGSAF